MTSEISAVIFDVGNVLINWQPEHYYDRTIGKQRCIEFFNEVDLYALQDRQDAGASFRETFMNAAHAHPKWKAEIKSWYYNWNKLASPAIEHSVHLLRALRAKAIPVFALTNFGEESFAISQTQFDFLHEFDRYYVSGVLKMVKPNAEIYAYLEHDCQIDPQSLLFTDDRLENITTAHHRGWQTHLFTSSQAWADCLVHYGLLTQQETDFQG